MSLEHPLFDPDDLEFISYSEINALEVNVVLSKALTEDYFRSFLEAFDNLIVKMKPKHLLVNTSATEQPWTTDILKIGVDITSRTYEDIGLQKLIIVAGKDILDRLSFDAMSENVSDLSFHTAIVQDLEMGRQLLFDRK